jgi:hypothetical protein
MRTLLPIACTGGGDQLFLDLTADRYGQVVGVLHGLPEWTGLHTGNLWGVLAEEACSSSRRSPRMCGLTTPTRILPTYGGAWSSNGWTTVCPAGGACPRLSGEWLMLPDR